MLSALEELDLSHNLLADHQCLSGLSKLKKLMIVSFQLCFCLLNSFKPGIPFMGHRQTI